MIAIKNTIISDDLLSKKFVCDLNACKGECCVSGESGAPLDEEELPLLMEVLEEKVVLIALQAHAVLLAWVLKLDKQEQIF